MKRVAASEQSLLAIARALVGAERIEGLETLLGEAREERPVGPTAMALLRHTLSAGVAREVVRRGGWRRDPWLRDGAATRARLWERPLPPLRFTRRSFLLLRWLACAPLAHPKPPSLPQRGAPTVADQLLLYLACDRLSKTVFARALGQQRAVREATLCWLAFPDLLVGAEPPVDLADRVAAIAAGDDRWVLEALQPDLARRWLAIERSKPSLTRPSDLSALGEAQRAALTHLLDGIDRAGRRDLAGFLVVCAARLARDGDGPGAAERWVGGLDRGASLRDRSAAAHAAAVTLRAAGRIARWLDEARVVRYIDDDYAVAQHLLARAEALGAAELPRAARLADAIESVASMIATPTERNA